MGEHENLQVFELSKGIVWGAHRLVALISTNANTHIRLGDHAHVIGAVTNSQSNFGWLELLDEGNHLSFLLWREPATNKNFARKSKLHETFGEPFALLDFEKAIAFNNSRVV